MSYWSEDRSEPTVLRGVEGELVSVRVRVDSRLLEEVLEALAHASFPINPEIRHGHPDTWVEFPAYERQIPELRRLVQSSGLRKISLDVANMLHAIA